MSEAKTADRILQAYHTLGLTPGQDAKQVKQAYRALARALHPDRNPDAQLLMARINDAYHELSEYFKTRRPDSEGWSLPLSRLKHGIGLHLSSWFGQEKENASNIPEEAIELPEALSEEDHWVLLGIIQEGAKLVYQVEISGNPKALALPLRRKRPCSVCQGSGNLWEHGQSSQCGNCGGRGYITKPASLTVPLPAQWQPGQRVAVESASLRGPLEVELYRPKKESISTKV